MPIFSCSARFLCAKHQKYAQKICKFAPCARQKRAAVQLKGLSEAKIPQLQIQEVRVLPKKYPSAVAQKLLYFALAILCRTLVFPRSKRNKLFRTFQANKNRRPESRRRPERELKNMMLPVFRVHRAVRAP